MIRPSLRRSSCRQPAPWPRCAGLAITLWCLVLPLATLPVPGWAQVSAPASASASASSANRAEPAAAASATPTPPAQDLLDLLRQARSADPQLSVAAAARGAVHEAVLQARAPLLPQASARAGFDHTAGGVSDGARARSLGLNLSQSLVDLAGLQRWRAAASLAEAQDAQYRAAEQALLLRVAAAYFGVLGAQDALATVQANEAAYAQQVAQAEERLRQGLSAALDVEQARTFHASARANTIAARQALADAREALVEITGSPAGALKVLREDLPLQAPQPADPQAWVTAALQGNPSLAAQHATLGAAERKVDAARAEHLPTLGAALSTGRGSQWPLPGSNDGRSVTTLGLQLNVPLFAGGAQQAAVRLASFQREGAASELEQRRRRVVRDVLERHRAVSSAIEQIEATGLALQAARKALASTRVGQGLGTQTMNELLQSIQLLGGALAAHAQARYQYVLARLQLQLASGTLSEADLAAVNALLI